MSEIFYRYSMHFSQYINRFIHSMACAGLWLYKSVLYTYTYSSSQKVHYEISSEIFSMVKLKLWLPDIVSETFCELLIYVMLDRNNYFIICYKEFLHGIKLQTLLFTLIHPLRHTTFQKYIFGLSLCNILHLSLKKGVRVKFSFPYA